MPDHIYFIWLLIAQSSFKYWAKFFHCKFSELKDQSSFIHRQYKKHNSRFKRIQKIKKAINFEDPQYKTSLMSFVEDLDKAIQYNTPVVFLDEAMFTFHSLKLKAWSSAYTNINVNGFAVIIKIQALLVAITLIEGSLNMLSTEVASRLSVLSLPLTAIQYI